MESLILQEKSFTTQSCHASRRIERSATTLGITATFSVPLDGGLTARCKRAVDTNSKLQEQVVSYKEA